ncbi:MAG: hypothetical protein Q4A58_07730 [Fusobacterium sp.]|uniref:hypothetical protein n=1 Tax=Fusobacterium sp. TaxID=68766 RepID=UPI0026DAA776|nr:hypothetical protein [Fusobacterium sp.]MDO4691166.1 hypothetical protein [Fusobacterium sp.]
MAKSFDEKDKEKHTTEYFISGAGTLKKARTSYTHSYFTSYNSKEDEISEYVMNTITIGAGSKDLGISTGIGYYFVDTYEEMQKVNKSFGGSISFLGTTIGIDLLSSSNSDSFYLSDLLKIKGIRVYGGKSFATAKMEGHIGLIDKNVKTTVKKYNILDFYKKESLPSNIRLFYLNDYNKNKLKGREK